MKTKNNISEDTMAGIGTAGQTTTSTSSTTASGGKKVINVNKKDLTDPKVKSYIDNTKDVDVNVIDEDDNMKTTNDKLTYLSNIKDGKGQISKPFTINDKRYQMVRVLTPMKEKGLGVYSLDETDESGENIIYDMKMFEDTIANKAKESVPSNPQPNVMDETTDENPNFVGYKHFILNKKTGKARKFKTIEELARASMSEDEQYMGMKSFKKYVDEALFGQGRKRSVNEVEPTVQTSQSTAVTTATSPLGDPNPELQAKTERLMELIKRRIPEAILKTITTPIAKREVIAGFAELVGVPRTGLSQLVAGIKALSKKPIGINERKIIKVKDLK